MADAAHSLKVVKEFLYRGETRRFSNRYHMTGPEITSYADFTTLVDHVTAAEADTYYPTTTIVLADYTAPGETMTRYSQDLLIAGSIATAHGYQAPGDAAALVKYGTAGRSSRNHPIYLYNYYHAPHVSTSDADYLQDTWQGLLQTYANHWLSGFEDGASHHHERCGPSGDPATTATVEDLVTHRDLPRRS